MASPIYDRIINAPSARTGPATMHVLNVLQDHIEDDKGVQVTALAASFLLLCERFGVSPQDAFTATKNLMASATGQIAADFGAVRLYLANEVK